MITIPDNPPQPADGCSNCQSILADNRQVRERLKELASDVLRWWKIVFGVDFVETKVGETPDQLAERARDRILSIPISNEAAIAVGEEAFKAGWDARSKAIDDYLMHDKTPDVEEAWSDYEPSEDIKALV